MTTKADSSEFACVPRPRPESEPEPGTHHLPNSDWTQFREAFRAGAAGQSLLVACRQLREWVDLPAADCARRLAAALISEDAARIFLQAKAIVATRLLREAFPSGVMLTQEALAGLDTRLNAGTATPAELQAVRRSSTLQNIGGEIAQAFPHAVAPPVPPDPRQEELRAMLPALERAMRDCDVHVANSERVAALQAAITEFRRPAEGWSPPVPTDHAWWLGMALYALGRAALEIGEVATAQSAFSEGAADFDRAGASGHAADMRRRVQAIATGSRADFDAVAASSLQVLLQTQDPLEVCASLAALATASHHAGDRFEFSRLARQLAELLVSMGYADPEQDVVGAVHDWINTAAGSLRGDELFAHLNEIGTHWALVMGARASERLGDGTQVDSTGVQQAEDCIQRIAKVLAQLYEEATAVSAETSAELAVWFGSAVAGNADRPADNNVPEELEAQAADHVTRAAALNTALYALRLACNAGATDAHLAEARRLIEAAETLKSRVHLVQAQLEHAYVLLALARCDEVANVTVAALRTLAPAHQTSLSAFVTSHERELYLTAVLYEVRARVGLRDHEGVLTRSKSVIAEIEEQRSRVNAPYQQSAFLSTRAEFYEYCAAAALKLGRHDLLLATTERLKASGAWRIPRAAEQLPALVAEEVAAFDREYAEVNRALTLVTARDPVAMRLREHRRQLATARAIARQSARPQASTPITVAAVQGALGANEAALSWFWLSDDVVLLLAFTSDRFETATIELSPDDRKRFERWLLCMRSFSGPRPALDELIPELDRLVDALAPVLLPDAVRRLIDGKTHLVLSPHRTLHLFPFHSARWRLAESDASGVASAGAGRGDASWMVEKFAIRYAPNLASLLVAWTGRRDGPVLALGIGKFGDSDLLPLENAPQEAAEVATVHGPSGRAVIDITRAAFVALPLSTYRCLHLATHGSSVLTGDALDDPLDCGIALADGILDGWQLEALDLPTELVVLAACYSGQRAISGRGLTRLPGDDLFGLQAVLFEAGVGTLLGALWPVDDASARAILVDFHRVYAAGAEPDAALQSALKAHLASPDRRHTRFDWAPFFLTSLHNPRAGRPPDPATVTQSGRGASVAG